MTLVRSNPPNIRARFPFARRLRHQMVALLRVRFHKLFQFHKVHRVHLWQCELLSYVHAHAANVRFFKAYYMHAHTKSTTFTKPSCRMLRPSDFAPWRSIHERVFDIRTSSASLGWPRSFPEGLETGGREIGGFLPVPCWGRREELGSILERRDLS
jgi:hypothetical protein